MSENELEEPRVKLELSNESKELLERLRTQQKIETFARSTSERGVLAQARLQSEADATSLVTALLAMNVESERQLYIARRGRATFSDEIDHLTRQVDACHAKIDELKNDADKSTTQKRELSEFLKNAMDENRALKAANRTVCVRDMFVRVLPHQERNDRPTVPSEAAIRLQTRIDAEEFVEKIEALYDDPLVSSLGKILHAIAKHGTIRSDLHDRLPEFADALADNAVTNEGFAVLFGIDLEPVFQEVHASNMRKGDGPIVDGKRRKPEGWTPPDVVGVLRKQGWQSSSESKVDEPIPYKLSCEIHGMIFGGDHECARCENAQCNGSEIDPIGEQSGNETSALAYLEKEAAKVDSKSQPKVPPRNAIPIDRTLWKSDAKIELGKVWVKIEDIPSLECDAKFFDQGANRRCMIEFAATDAQFGLYERLRQDKEILGFSISGSYIGAVRIVSIERGGGVIRKIGSTGPSAYTMQIEFSKVRFPVDG